MATSEQFRLAQHSRLFLQVLRALGVDPSQAVDGSIHVDVENQTIHWTKLVPANQDRVELLPMKTLFVATTTPDPIIPYPGAQTRIYSTEPLAAAADPTEPLAPEPKIGGSE